jgi:hypothetical protein
LLLSVTVAPPACAALVSVKVQALLEFGPRLAGLQVSEDTSTGATKLIVAFAEVLFNVAVNVAL